MRIYLIRHGQTREDLEGRLQKPDAEISRASKKRLSRLKRYLTSIQFSHVYSSPQPRARQTAKYLFGPKSAIAEIPYIHEYIRPKLLDGAPRQKGIDFWEKQHLEDKYNPNWRYDQGESFNDIVARVKKLTGFLKKHSNGSQIAVVGHGVFFRHLLGYMILGKDYSPKVFFDILRHVQITNGGYILLEYHNSTNQARVRQIFNL